VKGKQRRKEIAKLQLSDICRGKRGLRADLRKHEPGV
jgi:hypothetical protein